MKKKKWIISSTLLVSLLSISTFSIISISAHFSPASADNDIIWNHYSAVEPRDTKHGSKEFWANCMTLDYSLEEPSSGQIVEAPSFDKTSYFSDLTKDDERYIPSLFEQWGIDSIDLKPRTYIEILPVIHISVNGAHIPDRSDPNYHDYCPAELSYSDDDTNYNDINGKVRIRGTSSRWFKKKGYKIKFSSKVNIGGLPKSKKYNLLASYMDPTLLRDYLAMKISYDMNTISSRYAPIIRPVIVYLDDVNQGIYYLIDDIAASEDKINLIESEDINKAPFILEMDTLAHKDGVEGVNYFVLGTTDVFDYDGDGYTDLKYKLDTPEEVTSTQFQFIENYIKNCRSALINKDLNTFLELVDVNSFIDFFLLAEFFRNTDLAGRSTYLYLTDVNKKLTFGPSWDFDYSCSRPYQLGPNQDYTLSNAGDRFFHYDFWELFLDIPHVSKIIKQRYTYYLRPIIIYELKESKNYYSFYHDVIKENANKWYSEISDIDLLLENNFNWTFDYFDLRLSFYDSIYYLN